MAIFFTAPSLACLLARSLARSRSGRWTSDTSARRRTKPDVADVVRIVAVVVVVTPFLVANDPFFLGRDESRLEDPVHDGGARAREHERARVLPVEVERGDVLAAVALEAGSTVATFSLLFLVER